MSDTTLQIKEKLDIVEVVSSYIKLEKAGQSYKAKCPFHNEKTPSFFVSPKRGSYYCFGCGAKGDIFSFVEQFEGVDFVGALKMLAERAGVQLKFERKDKEKMDERSRLFECLERTTKIFEENLAAKKDAVDYLKKRGLTAETIKNWRLGFALDDWRKTEEELLRQGFTKNEMLQAGVIKENESKKTYDTFRNRIMFPIFDNAGRVVAFSGRIFKEEEGTAKYLNSPETELFKKSEILYGFHIAKNAIRQLNFSILVEGQMDLLMSHQAGWHNTVATSGTALTPGQLQILNRLSQNLLIAYDNDAAGIKASEKAAKLALSAGFNVKILKIPGQKDPADLIAKNPAAWKETIKSARHIVTFAWESLLEQKLPREKFVARFRASILPLLAAIPTNGERMRLVSLHQMALQTGLHEEHLLEEIHKTPIEAEDESGKIAEVEKKSAPENSPLRRLFSILYAIEDIAVSGIESKTLKEKMSAILGESFSNLSEQYQKERDRLVFEAELIYGANIAESEIGELVRNLEEDVLRSRLLAKMIELQKAELAENDKEVKILLKECQDISTRLSKIKNPVM
jgi:DNA primase